MTNEGGHTSLENADLPSEDQARNEGVSGLAIGAFIFVLLAFIMSAVDKGGDHRGWSPTETIECWNRRQRVFGRVNAEALKAESSAKRGVSPSGLLRVLFLKNRLNLEQIKCLI